jgi:protein-L-isoaspartate(D-aspartate) O-methyltransferase
MFKAMKVLLGTIVLTLVIVTSTGEGPDPAGTASEVGSVEDTATTAAAKAEPESWKPPRFEQRASERAAMVETIRRYRYAEVTDERVLAAMENVPRHRFVPEKQQRAAYADSPLPIGHGQTISQPYIVALMTQLAELEPGMKVLEVGTGSAYQAAVLSELTPNVFTIEIIHPLAERAQKTLGELGYDAVRPREGDGYYGWAEEAPFDRILVTAAAAHIPPPLLRQLESEGRMVIPVGPRWGTQQLLVVTKDAEGKSRTRSILPVRFVPLVGGEN